MLVIWTRKHKGTSNFALDRNPEAEHPSIYQSDSKCSERFSLPTRKVKKCIRRFIRFERNGRQNCSFAPDWKLLMGFQRHDSDLWYPTNRLRLRMEGRVLENCYNPRANFLEWAYQLGQNGSILYLMANHCEASEMRSNVSQWAGTLCYSLKIASSWRGKFLNRSFS